MSACPRDLPLVLVGGIATAVLVCGALAQLTVGRVVEWVPPHVIFAAVTGIGFLGNLWAAYTSGVTLLIALAIAVAAIYGQVTVNDMIMARYTADAWRGRVYAVRYFLLFISAGAAIGMISLLHESGGFALVLGVNAVIALLLFASDARSRCHDHQCRRPASRRATRRIDQNSGGIRSSTLTRMRFLNVRDDAAAVAGLRIAAIAEQRDPLARFDQRDQFAELFLRFRFLDVLVVDAPQRIGVAAACRRPAFRRCPEFLQMQVADSGIVQRCGELALGKARTA